MDRKWVRICPKCNKEIKYRWEYEKLKFEGKLCKICSRQDTGLKNKDKKRSEETKDKISKSMEGKISIYNQPDRGEKISNKLKGRNCWLWRIRNIIYKNCLYCLKDFTTTPFRKNNHHFCNNECKINFYKFNKKWVARFNPLACEIIEQYGIDNGYNFQHALNGGEYYIKELKFWLDGYDKNKNVVIEYMEKHHNRPKQVIKDKIREEKITNLLKCKFIKIYE